MSAVGDFFLLTQPQNIYFASSNDYRMAEFILRNEGYTCTAYLYYRHCERSSRHCERSEAILVPVKKTIYYL